MPVGTFDTAPVLRVRPIPAEPSAMAQPTPKIEAGAMDLPGLAAEPSEGNGLGLQLQEGAGPLFQNSPAGLGSSGDLRSIPPGLKPTSGRSRDEGLTCSAEPLRTTGPGSVSTSSGLAEPTHGRLDDCELRVRAAIARDLHDRVAQPLAALVVVLEELKQDPGDRRRVLRRIDMVQDQVRTALFGLREVLCDLRDQEWLDYGLVGRLRGELEALLIRHPQLQLRLAVSPRWPAAVRSRVGDHVLQIVREAVHNARFHGGANGIEVALLVNGRRAELVVSDDGRGLDGRRVRPGMGLLGIHERATLLGGRLVMGDRRGGGTRLRVTVPREVLG